jgi:NAD(P)-dependent dehydrogenase (short-subunit alcohol dehydrogenase family)
MSRLGGRVALVTGGTDGIGRGIAAAFVAEGARVAISGRSAERGERAVADIGGGDHVAFVPSDASTSVGAARAVDGCLERFGRLDVLVNNVGGAASEFALVHELSDEGWESGITLNLHSAFWTTRRAVPSMLEHGYGRIINISSVEGKLCTMATISPYVVAKHALAGLTKTVAFEYGEQGITCNSICPGAVATESFKANAITAAEAAGMTVDQVLATFVEHAVTKKLSTPEQVAAVAVLLASEEGANITGVQWSIDGGQAPW